MIALANSSGAIIKRYKYDSFGVEENPGIFDTNVFRYCGEYYDVETKTIYLRARYYNAETGRFTQQDGWSYAVLGFLIVVRSAVQGIFLPAYVLGAGAAELTARIVICSFLPALVNGALIDSGASSLAFAAVCFGDPGAWICASLLLLIPLFRYITGKKYKNTV